MQTPKISYLKKSFPSLDWTNKKIISTGWDYSVILLDNNYMVRIPKNSEAKKRAPIDFYFLKRLEKLLDISIPAPILKDDKSGVAVYKAVKGSAVTKTRYEKFSDNQKIEFSKSVARFLTMLHKIKIASIAKCNVPKKNKIQQDKEMLRIAKFVSARVSQKEKDAIDQFIIDRKKTLKRFKPVLTHSDLTGDHIFINNKMTELGVIDFSDSAIDDPARDFAGLLTLGEKFVKDVLRYYRGCPDKNILDRAQIYYKEVALTIMAMAIKGSKSTTIKEAKRLFQERMLKTSLVYFDEALF